MTVSTLIHKTPQLNPTQQQIATAPMEVGLQVLAGAGTGKTELIAHRYVHVYKTLLEQGVEKPEAHIVVLTFTDKAAASMALRIQQRLESQLGRRLELQSDDDVSWITTFHTLGKRFVQRHFGSLGFATQPSVLDRVGQNRLWETLLSDMRQGLLENLSTHVPSAASWGLNNDILSLASLTSLEVESVGKVLDSLKTVILRIKAAGLTPEQFREQARRQTESLTQFLENLPLVNSATGDAFDDLGDIAHAWTRYLQTYADDTWSPLADEVGMPEAGLRSLYRDAIGFLLENSRFYKTTTKVPTAIYEDFADLHAQSELELILIDVITATYGVYQARLRSTNAVDFDDLIQSAIALLQGNADLRAQYQQQFQCLIVDEFQDSNGSQLALLRQLMPRQVSNTISVSSPRLTVVGDVKQSIYGFRFAQPENLSLAFEGTQYEAFSLQTNYRSAPPILSAANALTQVLTNDPKQALAPANARDILLPVMWVDVAESALAASMSSDDASDEIPTPKMSHIRDAEGPMAGERNPATRSRRRLAVWANGDFNATQYGGKAASACLTMCGNPGGLPKVNRTI